VGFTVPRKIFKLVFAEEDLVGMEVRARSIPLGDFLRVTELAEYAENASGVEALTKISELFSSFVFALESWNLQTEDGDPIPASVDGLYRLDFDLAMSIIMAWLGAMSAVPDPLAGRSSDGGRSLEASIPMAPL
jgi:hypothetical protein